MADQSWGSVVSGRGRAWIYWSMHVRLRPLAQIADRNGAAVAGLKNQRAQPQGDVRKDEGTDGSMG